EEVPTVVATRRPILPPTPPVLAEQQQHSPLLAQVVPADRGGRGGAGERDEGGDRGTNARLQVANGTSSSGRGVGSGSAQPVRASNADADDRTEGERDAEPSPAAPVLVASDDRSPAVVALQNDLSAQRNQTEGRATSGSASGGAAKSNENTTPARPQALAPAVGVAQTDRS